MPHHMPLIGTIVAGLVIAFLLGALAHRLRMPPIVGYLLAGVVVGPSTPGFVADGKLAAELAEIGVILLMFGVGLHFTLKDLLSVRRIAVPGAVAQIGVAVALGTGLGLWLGWSLLASAIFGLALSVASTVVLLRALQSRDLVQTERGRIAVGWLIVEDLAMVLALVLLPPIVALQLGQNGAGTADILRSLGEVALKLAGFMAFMLIVARKVIPLALHWVAHSGSRELFRLAVLAIALGVAFGATLAFDVSLALGAFFAGMILGDTQLSRRAAEETLPLRDAFAVLFFVSVGMLFDPAVVVEQPGPLLATVAIIVLGKSLAAYAIVRAFGHPSSTALTISASLAQIGEFSFILAGLGVTLGALPADAQDLILAGAILSILINPILFKLIVPRRRSEAPAAEAEGASANEPAHAVLVGYGRVGRSIARRLASDAHVLTVIEDQSDMAAEAREAGLTVVAGDATAVGVLEQGGLESAAILLVAIPEGVEAGVVVRHAREMCPSLHIVARAHSREQAEDLRRWGADEVVQAEEEAAARMAASAVRLARI
ncbi:YbaL family putative K(+) efflux transporter [Novosphingobium sp. JCM 18896]|uniref:YbaL family putative K(+) efflux transporter n=1 Tax=Novosphingobium sp. JCM 18896 TaxID=2989731 RepID=UPI002221FE32|nr:YbaL family putative K(+) efflux transporter [Novosphingobium sp. JCM 18896]MCW1427703.1 Kef family K(+) transporter [Novosphingobium sp. JCM 18896]